MIAEVIYGESETVIAADTGPTNLTMRLRALTWAERVDAVMGARVRNRTGDPAFDRAFVFESTPADLGERVLVPTLRAAMLAVPRDADQPRLDLANGMLRLAVGRSVEPDAVETLRCGVEIAVERCRELHDAQVALGSTVFREGDDPAAIDPTQRAASVRAMRRALVRRALLAIGIVAVGVSAVAIVWSRPM